jgi:hypothetical protein
MVDYHPIQSYNGKLPEPEPTPEEDQEVQQPVAVDVVYNFHHEEGKSKTIALKVSLHLPVKS